MDRRSFVSMAPLMLAACGTPAPALRLYQLPLQAPSAPAAPAGGGAVWELDGRVGIPAALDRESLLLPTPAGSVLRIGGARWAEPLRDALPRLLLHDLALLRGADRIWPAPAPLPVARRLAVQLLALQADAGMLDLQARWSLTDPAGRVTPLLRHERIGVPLDAVGAEAAVQALRLAWWRLSERIVATAGDAGSAG